MFRENFWQLAILVVVVALRMDIACNVARCDESLAKELESKVSALADDFEFGMLDVASVASLSIETSPDSEYWFEGAATFTTFKTEGVEYKRAEWKLDHIEDVRTQQFSNYFDFHQCTVTNLRIRGLDFVNVQGIDRWTRAGEAGEQVSPCVAVIPIDWPVIYPFHFDYLRKVGEPTFQVIFRNGSCVSATQIDARTADSVWFGKVKTKEGKHLAFDQVRFKDDLPVLFETYSYQSGFRDLSDLPKRKDCIRVNRVETTWTKFDDVSVPSKVRAELNILGPGGIQTVHLTVDLKFWNSKTKEYEQIKNSVDESIQQVEASGIVSKTK